MRRAAVILAVLLGLLFGGTQVAQAANEVSNADSYGTMHVDPSGGYWGHFNAKPTACVTLERKTNAGDWVRSGMHYGSFTGPFRSCYNDSNPVVNWEIDSGLYVYGMRLVSNQGLYAYFCTTKSQCEHNL